MNLLNGIFCNARGLWLGLKTPKLFFLGLTRFVIVLVITIIAAWVILSYHGEIMELVWKQPHSRLIIWLWYVVSWLFSLLLVGLSAVLSYLLAQILFAVVLMDLMSRITERLITGGIREPGRTSFLQLFSLLIKQELPRSVVPVLISLILMLFGWLTPLGPVFMVIATGAAVIFLAWDNTDLLPARRMVPFRERFRFLRRNLLFHLGFGLPFLIPGLNILLLCFAPVGGTLFHVERQQGGTGSAKPI